MKALDLLKNIDRKCCTDRVNGLLDLAIKELEELENRSCDNCTHLRITQFRDYEKATCTNENCDEMFDSDVGNNFCCNKWEK